MFENKKIGLIIPAAGSGKRMGTETGKTFLSLLGKPVIRHTLEAFLRTSWVDQVVIVGRREEEEAFENLLAEVRREMLEQGKDYPHMSFVEGGKERIDSVYKGLTRILEEIDYVMVHDGARPIISREVIERNLKDVLLYDSSVVCVPSKDTVKIATDNQMVAQTPDRSRVFCIQTPQTFERSLLVRAYEQGRLEGILATDDSSLVEHLGAEVKLTLGSYANLKITTPEDLVVAELLLKELLEKSL